MTEAISEFSCQADISVPGGACTSPITTCGGGVCHDHTSMGDVYLHDIVQFVNTSERDVELDLVKFKMSIPPF